MKLPGEGMKGNKKRAKKLAEEYSGEIPVERKRKEFKLTVKIKTKLKESSIVKIYFKHNKIFMQIEHQAYYAGGSFISYLYLNKMKSCTSYLTEEVYKIVLNIKNIYSAADETLENIKIDKIYPDTGILIYHWNPILKLPAIIESLAKEYDIQGIERNFIAEEDIFNDGTNYQFEGTKFASDRK